jgi:D-tyrosyl-tRNA(Tyr) deacylase
MNENISFVNGEILIVSQFTLYGDIRKGRRPSYDMAESSEEAIKIYNEFIEKIKQKYDSNKIFTGVFGAMMEIDLINFGPVTILLDSKRGF